MITQGTIDARDKMMAAFREMKICAKELEVGLDVDLFNYRMMHDIGDDSREWEENLILLSDLQQYLSYDYSCLYKDVLELVNEFNELDK